MSAFIDVESKLSKAIAGSAKSAKEGRLIVRNLGFNVTKDQIQERFADFGEIVDVHLPASKRTNPVLEDGRRMKIPAHAGFAFVEFDTRAQAQAAIDAVNESKIGGRRVAVDFAYDARIFKASLVKEAKNASSAGPTASKKEEPKPEEIKIEEDEITQPVLPQKRKQESQPVEVSVTTPEKKQKQALPTTPENQRKLFILNLPYDATVSDIKEGLCEFGKITSGDIQLVLPVKDKESKFTGKAFVIFKSDEVAQKIIDLEKSSFPESFGDLYKFKDGTDKPTAPLEGSGCIVNGRRVAILKSLSKEEVDLEKQKKDEENKPKAPKTVNRLHIDLINAGWVGEDHPDWDTLSPQEQKLRTAANEERKFKLNNANYIINPKRLTIRNIPKQFENGDLKMAILRALAIPGSKKAKKAGLIKVAICKDKIFTPKEGAMPAQEKTWSLEMPESEDDDEKENANIPMKMKKKSRGFAFADFKTSEAALACLKAMNNKINGFGEGIARKPMVEFAFDDVRKLQIQKDRISKKKSFAPSASTGTALPEKIRFRKQKEGVPKKLSRGQKQRLKRREAKASTEEK